MITLQNILLRLLCFGLTAALANFQEGEFVPSARRGQFHGSRTVWHDLLGRHCPHFGKDSQVAIPIPQPRGHKAIHQNYKIQFAFDGESILTPWVQIIGKRSPAAPVVHIELEHTGEALISATAEVLPVSSQYLREHQTLLREFQNATHWPKHLLVKYKWKHALPISATAGLYLVFCLGILVTAVLGISVLISYEEKLSAFLADLAAEESPSAQHSAHWTATQKAE